MKRIMLLLIVVLAGCTSGKPISRADLGKDWPLTVETGSVSCEGEAVYFTAQDGTKYALNGIAKEHGTPDIHPIWADDPAVPGAKLSIGPLQDTARGTCP